MNKETKPGRDQEPCAEDAKMRWRYFIARYFGYAKFSPRRLGPLGKT